MATGCGVFLAIAPAAVGVSAAIFILVLILSRFVSLGSILAALCFPIAAFALGDGMPTAITGGICALMIVLKHSGNIKRLLEGTERRLGVAREG